MHDVLSAYIDGADALTYIQTSLVAKLHFYNNTLTYVSVVKNDIYAKTWTLEGVEQLLT
jgi:hypothetical protein